MKIELYLELKQLKLLTPETTNLLGSTENKITENKNGKNVPHLEITNIVNNDHQQDSRVVYSLVPNKSCGSLLEISPKNDIFLKHLIQNFKKLKYGLQLKQSTNRNKRKNTFNFNN